jgi:hypothetical protein
VEALGVVFNVSNKFFIGTFKLDSIKLEMLLSDREVLITYRNYIIQINCNGRSLSVGNFILVYTMLVSRRIQEIDFDDGLRWCVHVCKEVVYRKLTIRSLYLVCFWGRPASSSAGTLTVNLLRKREMLSGWIQNRDDS